MGAGEVVPAGDRSRGSSAPQQRHSVLGGLRRPGPGRGRRARSRSALQWGRCMPSHFLAGIQAHSASGSFSQGCFSRSSSGRSVLHGPGTRPRRWPPALLGGHASRAADSSSRAAGISRAPVGHLLWSTDVRAVWNRGTEVVCMQREGPQRVAGKGAQGGSSGRLLGGALDDSHARPVGAHTHTCRSRPRSATQLGLGSGHLSAGRLTMLGVGAEREETIEMTSKDSAACKYAMMPTEAIQPITPAASTAAGFAQRCTAASADPGKPITAAPMQG